MAWTTTTWANADWAAAAVLNEFVDAIDERRSALAGSAGWYGDIYEISTVNAGDDVQSKSLFVAIQGWIESYRHHFVVSHVAGDPWVGGHYDGEVGDLNVSGVSIPPVYGDLAAVFSAAGLAHSNWRRYTTHPDEAGGVAYGQMQAGDIIGPWIFEDIQKCLNVLVWTRRVPYQCSANGFVHYSGVARSFVSYVDAQGLCEAAYALDAGTSLHAYSWGSEVQSGIWDATLARAETHMDCHGDYIVWNGVTRHADWYVVPTKDESPTIDVWDDYGDDALGDKLYEDKLSLFSKDEPATDSTTIVSQTKLGSAVTKPNNPWATLETRRGWNVHTGASRVSCVLRWNVTGGFTYA